MGKAWAAQLALFIFKGFPLHSQSKLFRSVSLCPLLREVYLSNLSKRSGGRNNPTSKQVVASEELVPALLVLVGVTLSYKGLWQARETLVLGCSVKAPSNVP